MSREFKFRAWDGEKLIYKVTPSVFPQVYTKSKLEVCAEITDYEPEYFDEVDFIAVECIEQYTGLKDRNDKEIYEGDIVTMEYDLDDLEPSDYYVITFSEGCFRINDIHETEVGSYLSSWQIMGNIHENIELIGGKDE